MRQQHQIVYEAKCLNGHPNGRWIDGEAPPPCSICGARQDESAAEAVGYVRRQRSEKGAGDA